MALNIVNEDTTSYVTFTFRDKAGNLAVPLAVNYRVDCMTNGREVLDWTSVPGPMASSIEIVLPPAASAILAAQNQTERRVLQVVASYGLADQYHGEFQWEVRNLREPLAPILTRGDDYGDSDGRALKWTGGEGWPPLVGASATLKLTQEGIELARPATIEQPATSNKVVRVELTAAETTAMAAGRWNYQLVATLASGRAVTLASGRLTVKER